MDSASEGALLRNLIADNQQKEATERLYRWFEGKNAARQDAALALLSRINALEESVLGGLISQVDADLERNRITKAVLELSKQLDQKDTLPGARRPFGVLLAGGVILLLVLGYFLFVKSATEGDENSATHSAFAVTAILHEQGDESKLIRSGKVELVIGDIHLPAQDVTSNGQAVFANIPGELFHKPIRLIPQDMPYKVVSQTDSIAAQHQSIAFGLAPKPDTTIVIGAVFLPGSGRKPAVGAVLDFDFGNGKGITGDDGRFKIPVPQAIGKTIKLIIQYKGENRYNRDVTIGSQQMELTLTQ